MQLNPDLYYFCFDTETDLITPGNLTPSLVCVSTYEPSTDEAKAFDRFEGMRVIKEMLERTDVCFVGQNIAYDFGVVCNEDPSLLPLVFRAYDEERVACTQVFEKVAQVAEARTHEKSDMGTLVQKYLHVTLSDKKENRDEYPPEIREELERAHAADIETIRLANYPSIAANPNVLVWRTNFRLLRNEPIENYPSRAIEYILGDARYPWLVLKEMPNYPDMARQVSSAWDLHLMGCEGVGVDEHAVEMLERRLEEDTAKAMDFLTSIGIYDAQGRENTKATKMLVAVAYASTGKPTPDMDKSWLFSQWFEWAQFGLDREGKPTTCADYELFKQVSYLNTGDLTKFAKLRLAGESISYDMKFTKQQRERLDATLEAYSVWQSINPALVPVTEKGGIKTDKVTERDSGNPVLKTLADVSADKKLLSTYVPLLRKGLEYGKICPNWNVLVASGRTSCSRPNLQNQPRKPGVRECFVPKPGNVWIDVDYATAELRSLAQVCLEWFGYSDMADAIKAGQDLHLSFAAKMAGVPYDEAKELLKAGDKQIKRYRQLAKVANFGFPGGMGAGKMYESDQKSDYATGLTEEQFAELKQQWMDAFCEMKPYFKIHGDMSSATDSWSTYEQLYSGRLRGGVGYCDGCNTMFQGLTADGAKEALKLLTRDCYLNENSPLYGGRVVVFVHDEFMVEVPEERLAMGAVERVCELMVKGMEKYTPDVPAGADPAVLRRWRKDAPLIVRDSIPVPFEDRELSEEERVELEAARAEGEFAYWWKTVELGVEP